MEEKQTSTKEYYERLVTIENVRWKKILNVQLPYKYILHKLDLGFVLDIGCGTGRNLINLEGNGVGIDHNPYLIKIAREKGLSVYSEEDFFLSEFNIDERFDSILLSHVAEHMYLEEASHLIYKFMHCLKCFGKLVIITPQEKGYHSDSTHVEFMDWDKHRVLCEGLNCTIVNQFSFPFPRMFGKLCIYNEFLTVANKY